jgi:hypothetical protein
MRKGLACFLAVMLPVTAYAGLDVPPAPPAAPDMSAYPTRSEVTSAISGAQASSTTKQATIPTDGPGAGLCRQTIVPSEMVTSAGIAGTPGTCSRILQCGTSSTYVITQFNVGGGC